MGGASGDLGMPGAKRTRKERREVRLRSKSGEDLEREDLKILMMKRKERR